MRVQGRTAAAPGKPKTVFSLDTPYSNVHWPIVSESDQREVLGMLINLLLPIGKYRSQNVVVSKGKRQKKRKRKESSSSSEPLGHHPKASPDIQSHLTIGFNTTTRFLESLARQSDPKKSLEKDPSLDAVKEPLEPTGLKPLAAVFVPHSDPFLYSHLPLLIITASLAFPSNPSTRLIRLPKGAEDRLSAALSIPRVGVIGLADACTPDAVPLIEFIRQQIPEIRVPWLQDVAIGAYLPVNIKSVETTAPATPKKGGRS